MKGSHRAPKLQHIQVLQFKLSVRPPPLEVYPAPTPTCGGDVKGRGRAQPDLKAARPTASGRWGLTRLGVHTLARAACVIMMTGININHAWLVRRHCFKLRAHVETDTVLQRQRSIKPCWVQGARGHAGKVLGIRAVHAWKGQDWQACQW